MAIRHKTRLLLAIGFSAMLLLIVIVGISSISVINNLNKLNNDIYNHPFVVMNNLLVIKLNVSEIRRNIIRISFSSNHDDIDGMVSHIDYLDRQSETCFDIVMDRFLGDKSVVEAARQAFSDWRPRRAKIIELARTGQYPAAMEALGGENAAYFTVVAQRLDSMIAYAQGKAAAFRSQSDVERDRNLLILSWLVGLAVISGGGIFGFLYFKVHRTEQELAKAEALLRQSQKMEAVGQLTGGLAHDLNNVLAVISMNADMLGRKVADDDRSWKYIEMILKGVKRASGLTRRLLDFSRSEAREVKRVVVNDFILGMESLIAKSLTPAITLKRVLADDA